MNTAVDAIVLFLVLVVAVWTIGFGVLGATVARSSGVGAPLGFTIGAVLGPFGLAWLWWRTRRADGVAAPRTPDDLVSRPAPKDRELPL